MPDYQIDANGIVQNGKFQGYHIQDVLKYTEDLEDSLSTVGKGTTPPPQQPKDPALEKLKQASEERVSDANQLLYQRLEADDEQMFAASVPDYEKYREKIAELKKTLAPHIRIQKGVHAMCYAQVKLQMDEDTRRAVFGGPPKAEEKPKELVEEEEEAVEEEEPKPKVEAKIDQAEAEKAKKAVRVAEAPTGKREAPGTKRKPKLRANAKIERIAEGLGLTTDEYLLKLESQGVTQDQIDRGVMNRPNRRSAIYG